MAAYCIHGNEFLRTISEGMNKAHGESWARHYKKLYAHMDEADQLDDCNLFAEIHAFTTGEKDSSVQVTKGFYVVVKYPGWNGDIVGTGETEREAMIDTVKKIRRITFEE